MQMTWKPTAAGVLAIVSGALNMLVALGFSLFVPIASSARNAAISVGFVAGLFLVTGIIALIGGIFALQRNHWGFSLAGAICAMMPPATLLGILSTVFVTLARDEFRQGMASPAARPALADAQTQSAASGETSCAPHSSEPSEAERNA